MSTTWIITAHRGGAKLYEHTTHDQLTLVRDIPHPEGNLKNHEIDADRAGRGMENSAVGGSPMNREVDATHKVAQDFARTLADLLDRARNDGAYDQLVLVGEAHFLGLLRAALTPGTGALVIGSIDRELSRASVDDLREHLRAVMRFGAPQPREEPSRLR